MKNTITLKPGREKSLRRHHPWIFSQAIADIKNAPEPGATVEILAHDNTWLGRGAYSPQSQIRVRIWTFTPDETVDGAFFQNQLSRAINARQNLREQSDLNAYRLVNGESDRLPGLIIDRYNDFLVCQFTATGAEYWRETIINALQELIPCTGIYERSDLDIRAKENLPSRSGLLCGAEPPDLIDIQEGDCRYRVDIRQGHKTGFYLDQRDNRSHLKSFSLDKEVLNCFSYTAAFAIAALYSGAASVVNVDSSAGSLKLGRKNLELNSLPRDRAEDVEGNAFQILRRYRHENRKFDLIVLDPPKFVDSRAQLTRACRGYKDINMLAFQLLRPGGHLFTFSCSGLLETALFQKIIADAALDAGCEAQIIGHLAQAGDHPIALNFPEAHYLKGLVCRRSV